MGGSRASGPSSSDTNRGTIDAARAHTAEATAVVLNLTALGASKVGYMTIHPRNSLRPNASNINFKPGGPECEHGGRSDRRGRDGVPVRLR